jgi:hypothetical protein
LYCAWDLFPPLCQSLSWDESTYSCVRLNATDVAAILGAYFMSCLRKTFIDQETQQEHGRTKIVNDKETTKDQDREASFANAE